MIRLSSAPYIWHLSEQENARQGFFTDAAFRSVVDGLPEYLKDLARFASLTGWREGGIAPLSLDQSNPEGKTADREHFALNRGPQRRSFLFAVGGLGIGQMLPQGMIENQGAARQGYVLGNFSKYKSNRQRPSSC